MIYAFPFSSVLVVWRVAHASVAVSTLLFNNLRQPKPLPEPAPFMYAFGDVSAIALIQKDV